MDEWTYLLDRTRSSWRAAGSPRRVLTAVSGGADSVALLLVMRTLAETEEISLFAAHVDHGLRPESGQDAAFTAALCGNLGVPCRVMKVKVDRPGEDGARNARYGALLACSVEIQADALALAHHQRDQAETVLLHLLRGSGSVGLGGMAEYRAWETPQGRRTLLWRPFLQCSPQLLRRVLAQRCVSWREDASNQSDVYLRNYLRNTVFPLLAARIPQAERAIGRTARMLAQEADYFRREAEIFLCQHARLASPCRYVMGAALDALHPALRGYVLRAACPVDLDYEKTGELAALVPGKSINLPEGWKALRTEKRLHFLSPAAEAPQLGALRVRPAQGETGDGISAQAIPLAVFAACHLRFRQPGDFLHPLGAPGEKSIQDYWVDKKVDRPFRPYMPLLCQGSRVIWSVGVGPAEEARAVSEEEMVLVTYEGFLPGENPGGK